MSYNGGEIVELLGDGEWSRTTLRDAYFICKSFGYDETKYIRRNEGSLDGGVTWKVRYGHEFGRLGKTADSFQWRVKGD
jgi:hypothetical protein